MGALISRAFWERFYHFFGLFALSVNYRPVVLHRVHHSLYYFEMRPSIRRVHHAERARNVSTPPPNLLIFHLVELFDRLQPVVLALSSLEILGMTLSLEYWDVSPFFFLVYLTHSCEIKCCFFWLKRFYSCSSCFLFFVFVCVWGVAVGLPRLLTAEAPPSTSHYTSYWGN